MRPVTVAIVGDDVFAVLVTATVGVAGAFARSLLGSEVESVFRVVEGAAAALLEAAGAFGSNFEGGPPCCWRTSSKLEDSSELAGTGVRELSPGVVVIGIKLWGEVPDVAVIFNWWLRLKRGFESNR